MKKDIKQIFNEYYDYCQFSQGLRSETLRGYKAIFDTFIKIMPEVTDVQSLSMEVINEFFKRLQTRKRIVGINTEVIGVKKSTIRTYWSKLNPFFKWLIVGKYMENNPLSEIPKPKVEYNDHRALDKEYIEKIITAITLYSKNVLLLKRDVMMVYILTFCGLRKTELRLLQVRDIDINGRTIQVRGETSKSGRTRLMPINSTLMMHLEEYLRERKNKGYKTEYLIVSNNNDRGLSEHGIKHWVTRLSKASGVKFHLHRFRHTFARNLGSQNTSYVKIQKLMGHTDLRMTNIYLRSMNVEDVRGDVNRLTIDNLV